MRIGSPCSGPSIRLFDLCENVANPNLILLTDSHCQDVSLVGGKARNLSRLALLGLPVPAGFCLTTGAYRAFLTANSLGPRVESFLVSFRESNPATCRLAREELREAFLAGRIPTDLESEIQSAYARLGTGAVAVRSSATMEDLATSSAAGGHDTLLNVRSLPSLDNAIKDCWASLWTDRAVQYRARFGINEDDVALAILVQKMVPAHISGVAFTAEPVTGNRQRIVVEACWGLGQALVSGEVTPDHYEIERSTLTIYRRRQGRQTEMLSALAGGGVQAVPVADSLRARACLDGELLRRIAEMSVRIESHFGVPQDIEWAVGNEFGNGTRTIYVLQARPITTLTGKHSSPSVPQTRWESPVPGAIWVRGGGGLAEYLPTPPSPLYTTAQLPAIVRLMDERERQMGTETPRPPFALINGHYYSRQDYRIKPKGVLLPLRYWRVARRAVRWWRHTALPAHVNGLGCLSSFCFSTATEEDLLNYLEKMFEFNATAWDTAVWASKNSQFTEPLFGQIFNRLIRPLTGGNAVAFLRGYESHTMAGERAQWQLAESALRSPEISDCLRRNSPEDALERLASLPSGRLWLSDFLPYCRTYGHGVACHDYMHPTAADVPAKALSAIRTRMELGSIDPADRQRQLASEREEVTAKTMAQLSRFPVRKALFRWVLAWAQEGAAIREDAFFYALQGWPLARRAIVALGNQLVRARLLSTPDDIFFLTWPEVRRACKRQPIEDYSARIVERRKAYEWQSHLQPPHWVPLEGPSPTRGRRLKVKIKRLLLGREQSRDGSLRGAPVSPGVVTGPARIIRSIAEFPKLQSGEILVAPTATPEWMPTFTVAAGLVTDTGGPLSHSSIVVREFGIPAIMGAQGATTSIVDGQVITIDGTQGLIHLH